MFLAFVFVAMSTAVFAQAPSSTEEEPAVPKKESGGFPWWTISVVLALGAGGYAWFVGEAAKRRASQLEGYIKQVRSAQKKAGGAQTAVQTAPVPQPKDDRAVQALDKRIGTLEKELEDLRAELQRKTRTTPAPPPTPSQARLNPTPKTQPAQATTPASLPSVMETVNKATTPAAPTGPQTKWAKYADAGDGFSVSALSDEQDGEKIFELSIADAVNASFRVVSARGAQQMALHDPTFYFSKACTYDTLPTPQSTITTEAPGSLKLQGGKWVIQRPAKIRFS